MKKTVLLLSLIGCCAAAQAGEVLYQWEEADGSLTFSPVPPPEGSGIKYKIMNSSGNSPSPVLLSASDPSPAPETPIAAGHSTASSIEFSKPVNPGPKLSYAPNSGGDQPTQGISRASSASVSRNQDELVQSTEIVPAGGIRTGANNLAAAASAEKNRHCSGLRKRIVSLEQVMSGSNDALTMDNAVTQITVYQHSFNQHCQD